MAINVCLNDYSITFLNLILYTLLGYKGYKAPNANEKYILLLLYEFIV